MTTQPSTLRSEMRALLQLAWPIMLTQLSMMSLGVRAGASMANQV